MIINIYETTLELIEKEVDILISSQKSSGFYMMKNLVNLMGEHDWNKLVEGLFDWVESQKDLKEEDKFGFFFYNFHKQFRQTDSFNVVITKDLGRLNEEEIEYWKEYAEKHDYSLSTKIVGRNKFEKTVGELNYHHASGQLDMLFWHLIQGTTKVELIMEHLWNMYKKGHKTFEEYSWSGDYINFIRSKRKKRLTE